MEEPLADRTIGIVAVAIHARIMGSRLFLPPIPALPDRGSPILNGVTPTRVGCVRRQRAAQGYRDWEMSFIL